MALDVYYDKDADLARLAGKTVAVIGYGSQGHAHALNLSRSGVSVVVGLRKDSASWTKAEAAGSQAQAQDLANGRELFNQNCASCHGLNAQGTKDPKGTPVGRLIGIANSLDLRRA